MAAAAVFARTPATNDSDCTAFAQGDCEEVDADQLCLFGAWEDDDDYCGDA